MIKRIYSLVVKELIAALRDKKSRYILIIPPLVQLLIFSMAATLDVQNVSIGICNHDTGPISVELEQRFIGSPTFSNIKYFHHMKEAENALVMQEICGILHFNSNFSKDLLAEQNATAFLIFDGRKSNSTQIVLGYAQKIVDQYNSELLQKQNQAPSPSILIQRNWFNPNLIYQWFTVPGLVAILAMTVSLTVTALSIAREKEIGTFEQLLVSPLTPIEILLGKAIPGVIIGVAEASLILMAGVFIFHIPFTGSILAFYFSLV
ncbi:MAG: ABC transporter permease, partial [Chlamydiia bacterium]